MKVRARATIWRLRWLIAAACVGTAIAMALLQLRPPEQATTEVLVAARDLSAGSVLTADDLRTRDDPDPPDHQPRMAEVVGERLAIGLPSGMPLATTMLVGPGLADGAPEGTVVTPVRLADPAILQLARPGDQVDLYLSPADTGGASEQAELITRGAVILSVPDAADGESSLLPAPSTAAPPDVVVLAVRARDATVLTGASGFAPFRAVLVEPGTR